MSNIKFFDDKQEAEEIASAFKGWDIVEVEEIENYEGETRWVIAVNNGKGFLRNDGFVK